MNEHGVGYYEEEKKLIKKNVNRGHAKLCDGIHKIASLRVLNLGDEKDDKEEENKEGERDEQKQRRQLQPWRSQPQQRQIVDRGKKETSKVEEKITHIRRTKLSKEKKNVPEKGNKTKYLKRRKECSVVSGGGSGGVIEKWAISVPTVDTEKKTIRRGRSLSKKSHVCTHEKISSCIGRGRGDIKPLLERWPFERKVHTERRPLQRRVAYSGDKKNMEKKKKEKSNPQMSKKNSSDNIKEIHVAKKLWKQMYYSEGKDKKEYIHEKNKKKKNNIITKEKFYLKKKDDKNRTENKGSHKKIILPKIPKYSEKKKVQKREEKSEKKEKKNNDRIIKLWIDNKRNELLNIVNRKVGNKNNNVILNECNTYYFSPEKGSNKREIQNTLPNCVKRENTYLFGTKYKRPLGDYPHKAQIERRIGRMLEEGEGCKFQNRSCLRPSHEIVRINKMRLPSEVFIKNDHQKVEVDKPFSDGGRSSLEGSSRLRSSHLWNNHLRNNHLWSNRPRIDMSGWCRSNSAPGKRRSRSLNYGKGNVSFNPLLVTNELRVKMCYSNNYVDFKKLKNFCSCKDTEGYTGGCAYADGHTCTEIGSRCTAGLLESYQLLDSGDELFLISMDSDKTKSNFLFQQKKHPCNMAVDDINSSGKKGLKGDTISNPYRGNNDPSYSILNINDEQQLSVVSSHDEHHSCVNTGENIPILCPMREIKIDQNCDSQQLEKGKCSRLTHNGVVVEKKKKKKLCPSASFPNSSNAFNLDILRASSSKAKCIQYTNSGENNYNHEGGSLLGEKCRILQGTSEFGEYSHPGNSNNGTSYSKMTNVKVSLNRLIRRGGKSDTPICEYSRREDLTGGYLFVDYDSPAETLEHEKGSANKRILTLEEEQKGRQKCDQKDCRERFCKRCCQMYLEKVSVKCRCNAGTLESISKRCAISSNVKKGKIKNSTEGSGSDNPIYMDIKQKGENKTCRNIQRRGTLSDCKSGSNLSFRNLNNSVSMGKTQSRRRKSSKGIITSKSYSNHENGNGKERYPHTVITSMQKRYADVVDTDLEMKKEGGKKNKNMIKKKKKKIPVTDCEIKERRTKKNGATNNLGDRKKTIYYVSREGKVEDFLKDSLEEAQGKTKDTTLYLFERSKDTKHNNEKVNQNSKTLNKNDFSVSCIDSLMKYRSNLLEKVKLQDVKKGRKNICEIHHSNINFKDDEQNEIQQLSILKLLIRKKNKKGFIKIEKEKKMIKRLHKNSRTCGRKRFRRKVNGKKSNDDDPMNRKICTKRKNKSNFSMSTKSGDSKKGESCNGPSNAIASRKKITDFNSRGAKNAQKKGLKDVGEDHNMRKGMALFQMSHLFEHIMNEVSYKENFDNTGFLDKCKKRDNSVSSTTFKKGERSANYAHSVRTQDLPVKVLADGRNKEDAKCAHPLKNGENIPLLNLEMKQIEKIPQCAADKKVYTKKYIKKGNEKRVRKKLNIQFYTHGEKQEPFHLTPSKYFNSPILAKKTCSTNNYRKEENSQLVLVKKKQNTDIHGAKDTDKEKNKNTDIHGAKDTDTEKNKNKLDIQEKLLEMGKMLEKNKISNVQEKLEKNKTSNVQEKLEKNKISDVQEKLEKNKIFKVQGKLEEKKNLKVREKLHKQIYVDGTFSWNNLDDSRTKDNSRTENIKAISSLQDNNCAECKMKIVLNGDVEKGKKINQTWAEQNCGKTVNWRASCEERRGRANYGDRGEEEHICSGKNPDENSLNRSSNRIGIMGLANSRTFNLNSSDKFHLTYYAHNLATPLERCSRNEREHNLIEGKLVEQNHLEGEKMHTITRPILANVNKDICENKIGNNNYNSRDSNDDSQVNSPIEKVSNKNRINEDESKWENNYIDIFSSDISDEQNSHFKKGEDTFSLNLEKFVINHRINEINCKKTYLKYNTEDGLPVKRETCSTYTGDDKEHLPYTENVEGVMKENSEERRANFHVEENNFLFNNNNTVNKRENSQFLRFKNILEENGKDLKEKENDDEEENFLKITKDTCTNNEKIFCSNFLFRDNNSQLEKSSNGNAQILVRPTTIKEFLSNKIKEMKRKPLILRAASVHNICRTIFPKATPLISGDNNSIEGNKRRKSDNRVGGCNGSIRGKLGGSHLPVASCKYAPCKLSRTKSLTFGKNSGKWMSPYGRCNNTREQSGVRDPLEKKEGGNRKKGEKDQNEKEKCFRENVNLRGKDNVIGIAEFIPDKKKLFYPSPFDGKTIFKKKIRRNDPTFPFKLCTREVMEENRPLIGRRNNLNALEKNTKSRYNNINNMGNDKMYFFRRAKSSTLFKRQGGGGCNSGREKGQHESRYKYENAHDGWEIKKCSSMLNEQVVKKCFSISRNTANCAESCKNNFLSNPCFLFESTLKKNYGHISAKKEGTADAGKLKN
ncbi:conserved Plasmodium protein, unknown function [Plasmodium ovale]|uniref:Uncharacterized protein n=1 Tax=Plasmodium ovale TaxID=36330 RepID=A0A1D3KZ12_PLAOA|nr:conserved Plasmodium protein, unknown function [Plasmodium ovale]